MRKTLAPVLVALLVLPLLVDAQTGTRVLATVTRILSATSAAGLENRPRLTLRQPAPLYTRNFETAQIIPHASA